MNVILDKFALLDIILRQQLRCVISTSYLMKDVEQLTINLCKRYSKNVVNFTILMVH